MVIATEMAAIADDPEYLKKDKDGNIKTNRDGETMFDGPRFFADMEERTGYGRQSVNHFLYAHTAMGNLIDYGPDCKTDTRVSKMQLPDSEKVIRPLANKRLNEDPELQAAIWQEVVEEAGDQVQRTKWYDAEATAPDGKVTKAQVKMAAPPPAHAATLAHQGCPPLPQEKKTDTKRNRDVCPAIAR